MARIAAVVPSCSSCSTLTSTFGQVVVGQLDAFDRADRLAADQDLVVGHELAGVLEEEVVLVAAAAAEEDDGERDHRRPPGPR